MTSSDSERAVSVLQVPPLAAACLYCRTKKIRCEGGQPCTQCSSRNEQCLFIPARRRKRRAPTTTKSSNVSQRLQRLESLVASGQSARTRDPANTPPPSTHSTLDCGRPVGDESTCRAASRDYLSSIQPEREQLDNCIRTETLRSRGSTLTGATVAHPQQVLLSPQSSGISATQTSQRCTGATPWRSSSGLAEEASLVPNDMSNWEYNGPRSVMSIFSQPGLEWIAGKLPGTGIKGSLLTMMTHVTSRLSIGPESSLSLRGSASEPSKADAQKYCKAFFEDSFEASLGIVERRWFMSRLDASFPGADNSGDHSWYAMRNTVFAIGSRIYLTRTASYSHACAESLKFFGNSLSVQVEMLHRRTPVLAVRALALMAYFTEAIGSPTIQYCLISDAMRLAISKGLHRQPAKSWCLSDDEVQQRSRLFWAIYSLDRQISLRSGRPPAIGDEDISCVLPAVFNVAEGNFDFHQVYLGLIQRLSKAYNRLSTARALELSARDTVRAIAELDDDLQDYKRSVQSFVDLDESLDSVAAAVTSSVMPLQLRIILHFMFYEVALSIHSMLALPWLSHINGEKLNHYHDQVQRSSAIVAAISRKAILGATYVHINPNTPVSLAVHLPLRATLLLFVAILGSTSGPSTPSDLIILDVAAGFASRLQFVSEGELHFPLVRKLADWARNFIELGPTAEPPLSSSGVDELATGALDLDVESWSTFWPFEMNNEFPVTLTNTEIF